MLTKETIVWSTQSADDQALIEGLKQVESEQPSSLLIIACSDNQLDTSELTKALKQCNLPISGGVFPKIINRREIYDTGTIILGLPFELTVNNYSELDQNTDAIEELIESNSSNITLYQNFLIFADALCHSNEDFIHHFHEYIGSGITVIGGGTGSLEFIPKPCIFTNKGLIHNAVQVVGIPGNLSRSTSHGWEICDGPYLVTGAKGHRLESLDYQPAFEVYRDTIQRLSGNLINKENFFDVAKDFPLGIVDISGNVLVRDPITTDTAFLECVGNVPINATINILKGDHKKLIQASNQLANEFKPIDNPSILLLFDCISRILYLQDEFSKELEALQGIHSSLPMIGGLSLGEITNSQYGSIDLLNKSTVIGMA